MRALVFWISTVLILIFMYSCQKETTPIPTTPEDTEKPTPVASNNLKLTYSNLPFDIRLNKNRYKFAKNIPYGEHPRNQFDIILANEDQLTPLVVYVHGGGFTRGEKENAYIHEDTIRAFITEGISFATINYRLLSDTPDGVISSLNDVKRCVQFIRFHTKSLNINPKKIAIYGTSAGAGAGIWLATRSEMAIPNGLDSVAKMSSRVSAVVALSPQATYDILKWEDIFKEFNFSITSKTFDQQTLLNFYAVDQVRDLQTPALQQYRRSVDMLSWMTSDDPAIFLHSAGPTSAPLDIQELYHHPYHASTLRDRAIAVGIPQVSYIPGMRIQDKSGLGPVGFLIQKLK